MIQVKVAGSAFIGGYLHRFSSVNTPREDHRRGPRAQLRYAAAMKELANRARDRDDIEHLQMILEEQRKR